MRSVLRHRNAWTSYSMETLLKYSPGRKSNILKKCPRTRQVSNSGKLRYLSLSETKLVIAKIKCVQKSYSNVWILNYSITIGFYPLQAMAQIAPSSH